MRVRSSSRVDRATVLGLSGLLILLFWGAIVSPAGGLIAHGMSHDQPAGQTWSVQAMALFLTAWTVMTAAMMLPTALPAIATFSRLAGARPGALTRVGLFVLGYLGAWAAFGLAAYLADRPLHLAADLGWIPANGSLLIGGSALLLAGVYQLTPLKQMCLSKCRSPLSFLMNHWRDGRRGALALGLRHGAWCVGCCWALMFLMFALGAASLLWMLALTGVMFAEKVVKTGRFVEYAAGLYFAGWGLATIWSAFH